MGKPCLLMPRLLMRENTVVLLTENLVCCNDNIGLRLMDIVHLLVRVL